MSLNKSATRRVSLLAGSSLVAATLATVAFTGVALAPTSAFAANECAPIGVDPTANGPAPDTRACAGSTTYQTTGITYSSAGNLTVNATGTMNVGTVGINLTGNTTDIGSGVLVGDNVTFSANNTITGTAGAVIDATSTSGDISVTTIGIAATTAGMTHAVRMQSTGGGDITFVKNAPGGFANAASAINNTVAGADAAVAAITNGGNITMTINSSNPTGNGSSTGVAGRARGILAQTSGAGSVTLNVTGRSGIQASRVDGVVAADIVAGTGGVNVNLTTGIIGGRATTTTDPDIYIDALALRVVSNSAVSVLNTGGGVIGAVDFSGVTAGGVAFQNLGAGPEVNTDGSAFGGGAWSASGDSVFTSQNDLVLLAGVAPHVAAAGASIDFGAGTDTFNMTGVFIHDGMVISNLEAFNNSGTIWFGDRARTVSNEPRRTDGHADDVLSFTGLAFTATGSSRIMLDVNLGGIAQVGCETPTGAADCLDLRDSTTVGSTVVSITDSSEAAQLSGYVPQGITLVDVSGSGTTSATHFTLDPASTNGYVNPLYGPAFERPGAFVYIFRYDEENQRFVLISQPKNRDVFDYAILSGAAQSIWRLTSETVTNRQTDLRDGAEGGSVWLRTAGEVTRRDQSTGFDGWDGPVTFDNSYNLYAGTIMGGMDLLSGSSGEFDYVLGVQIGYVSSSFDMDESESSGRFTGGTGGLYASFWSDWFFLDGTVNINGLALDYKHPALGSKTTTYVNSAGASVESGVRTRLTENTFAEPMAAVSWVRTSFEEISLSVGEVQPADAESLRGGLGVRLGANLPGESVNASYFVTGMAWNEFEGESGGVVHNPGVDLPFADELTGAFGEAELGINVFNAANTLSAFATTGVRWKEGYSAVNLALGVRLAW